jgi:mono/diheme cytochrome c family protein
VTGARTCSIDGAINGTSVFPGGVATMQFLKGVLSAAQVQAISNYLNRSDEISGQQRYLSTCAGCHGASARGGRTGANVRGATAADTSAAISGIGSMNYLSCLPASDINSIGRYLRGSSDEHDEDEEHDEDDEEEEHDD